MQNHNPLKDREQFVTKHSPKKHRAYDMSGNPITREHETEVGLVQDLCINLKKYDYKNSGDDKFLETVWTIKKC